MPKVVEAILSAHACKHPAVRRTCMSLLGELCEWVERHGECLPACLQCLLRAVAEPATSLQAAAAVHVSVCVCERDICLPIGAAKERFHEMIFWTGDEAEILLDSKIIFTR